MSVIDRFCVDCQHYKFAGAPIFERQCRHPEAPRDPVSAAWPTCRSQRAAGAECQPIGIRFQSKPPEPPAFEEVGPPRGLALWKGLFTRRRALVYFLIAFAIGWMLFVVTHAQEKDARYPRSWRMKSGPSFLDLDVDIIETAGVCLYLVKSGGAYGGYTIAAVAKTQLPRGVGCQ